MNNSDSKKRILLHACCGICSGYPITALKELGYDVIVHFYNPNIYPELEYQKRLEAEKILCDFLKCELIIGEYDTPKYYEYVKGLEDEPEKGLRCEKCFELRLTETADLAKKMGIKIFTTTMVVSPHKNFDKLTQIGLQIAKKHDLEYLAINFRKKDGFLKTNKIANNLGLYRQKYCGCRFALEK